MKIAACLIVKDDSEVKQLKTAINSVIEYTDSLHITANGDKTDEIKALISSTREKYPSKIIDYSYLAWDKDFSKQRNFNFSRVPKDTDFIFWMDSDDILIGGEYLRDTAMLALRSNKHCVFLTYWYGCSFNGEPSVDTFEAVDIEHQRERLLKPGYFTWKGKLHETPVTSADAKNAYVNFSYDSKKRPIAVMHTATIENAKEKMWRNKEILELQLKEEREKGEADPRTLLYLMKIYVEMGQEYFYKECLKMGEEYLQKSGWDEERAVCNDIMARSYSALGNHQMAVDLLHEAIKEYPHTIVFYIRLALAYFNLDKYRQAKHWLDIGSKIEFDKKSAGVVNIQELKILFAQLELKLAYNVDKNTKKALEAAKLLYKLQKNKHNKETLLFLQDINDLNDNCKNTHELIKYLESIGEEDKITKLLSILPDGIAKQPFAINYFKKYSTRTWEDDEICYFANFGGEHFEKWDESNLKKGIGGSETAVIRLAEEWAKKGYRVTIYGDPVKKHTISYGKGSVTYLPHYYFNIKDRFNIFIQWRASFLVDKIVAKKILLDLHDIYFEQDIKDENIDKIMVKSNYHKDLSKNIPDDKFLVISNGI